MENFHNLTLYGYKDNLYTLKLKPVFLTHHFTLDAHGYMIKDFVVMSINSLPKTAGSLTHGADIFASYLTLSTIMYLDKAIAYTETSEMLVAVSANEVVAVTLGVVLTTKVYFTLQQSGNFISFLQEVKVSVFANNPQPLGYAIKNVLYTNRVGFSLVGGVLLGQYLGYIPPLPFELKAAFYSVEGQYLPTNSIVKGRYLAIRNFGESGAFMLTNLISSLNKGLIMGHLQSWFDNPGVQSFFKDLLKKFFK